MSIIYNFGLYFDKEVEQQIYQYSKSINKEFSVKCELDENNTPHISVVKFEVPKELSEDFKQKISEMFSNPLEITFSGIIFLPSKDGGAWVEIGVLKSKELLKLQEEFYSLLSNIKILSGIGDLFRPHLTLNKIDKIKNINIALLDYDLLRVKNIKAYPKLSYPGKDF